MRWSLLSLPVISLAALLSCPAASADTFDFNFSGSGITGSGTFTASATGTPGRFLINSVTGTTGGTAIPGTTGGTAIQGILPPNTYPPSGLFPNDNLLLFPLIAGGALSVRGFSYNLTDGTDINIFFFAGGYDLVHGSGLNSLALNSFSVTDTTTGGTITTPEPGTFLLLATGALGIAGAIRRRFSV